MDFKPNITPADVVKKGAFGGTNFRDIYSNKQISRSKRIVNRFVDILKSKI